MNLILFVGRIGKKTSEDHVSAYSAQAAFYIILSFIPFILLLLTSVKMTSIREDQIIKLVYSLLPMEFYITAKKIINEVFEKSTAVIPVTAITALWSASRALLAVNGGLNSVYDVEENRNYIMLRLRSALYTVLLLGVILLSLVLLVFGNQIHGFFAEYIPLIADVTAVIISMRTVGTLAILVVFFSFLYKYLPNRKAPLITQVPGALFTAVGWAVFSFGFSWYLEVFNGLSNMYGSLTTIVLIMLWLYFCMYIMLLGAEINVEMNDKILEMSYERKMKREQKKYERQSKRR